MKNPPKTAAEMHGLIARQHPRLFSAHADTFGAVQAAAPHPEPAVLVRGIRCVSCESSTWDPGDLRLGLCADCHP